MIIGATGSIGTETRQHLLEDPNVFLTLLARNTRRLKVLNADREQIVTGDATDLTQMKNALKGQDAVFVAVSGPLAKIATTVTTAMKAVGVPQIAFIASMGIYNEIPASMGASGNLDKNPMLNEYRKAADIVENSGLTYTIIRPGWFDQGSHMYTVSKKGEPFGGHDVSRWAIADLVEKVLVNGAYANQSLGVHRPA